MFPVRLISCYCLLLLATATALPQITVSPAEAEAQKCADKIANVRRDVLGKYDDALGDMQLTLQKAADLEGALTVRNERQRLKAEQSLDEKDYVNEPKALRALQTQMVGKIRELSTQLVQESLPRLIEFKKALTVQGKLDEAVNVRTAIEQLQNTFVPVVRADSSAIVPVETLLLAYAGDRSRADKTYKGQKITIHGILGGYRQDPAESKFYQLFLTGGSGGNGWVQCSMSTVDFRFREEKGSFGAVSFVITTRDGDTNVRLQKGQAIDIRGFCTGLDEVIKLDRCEMPH